MKVRNLVSIGAVGVVLCCIVLSVRGDDVVSDKAEQPVKLGRTDETRAELRKQLKEALSERVVVAQRCLDAVQAAFDAQTITLDQAIDAMDGLNEAKLAVATTREQRLEALERNVKLRREVEKKTELLYRVGATGGEAAQYAQAERARRTAEIELLRERLKD